MNDQKHLGHILDSCLSFKKHLNENIRHETIDLRYKAPVRSYLDYFDIIYHIPSRPIQVGETLNALMEKTERIQYQAALAITGAWQGSCRSILYEELGWESLSDRRWCRRILQIHKIMSDKTPSYLKKQAPKSPQTIVQKK